jgi:hypothetical protein
VGAQPRPLREARGSTPEKVMDGRDMPPSTASSADPPPVQYSRYSPVPMHARGPDLEHEGQDVRGKPVGF